jgi:hypothetical protein
MERTPPAQRGKRRTERKDTEKDVAHVDTEGPDHDWILHPGPHDQANPGKPQECPHGGQHDSPSSVTKMRYCAMYTSPKCRVVLRPGIDPTYCGVTPQIAITT